MKARNIFVGVLAVFGIAVAGHAALTSNDAIPVGPTWEVASLSSGDKLVTLSEATGGFDILLPGDTVLTQGQFETVPATFSTMSFPFTYYMSGTEYEGTMQMRWHQNVEKCHLNLMTGRTDNINGYRDIGGVNFAYTMTYGSSRYPDRSFQYSAVRGNTCYQFNGSIIGQDTSAFDDTFRLVRFFDAHADGSRTYLAPEVSLKPLIGSIVQCEGNTQVYEIVSASEAKWFRTEAVFFGKGHGWDDMKTISCDVDTEFPGDYTIGSHNFPTDVLVKFYDTDVPHPEVYAVTTDCSPVTYCNDVLTHIKNEAAAVAHYGADWQSLIVQLPYYTLDNFLLTGREITVQ